MTGELLGFGGGVRESKILGHAIAFDQMQIEATVPVDQACWNGSRARTGHQDIVQAQFLAHFLLDDTAQDGDAEQAIEFFLRHFGQYTLLEFEPQARHRDEYCRACALQILHEGIKRLCKVNPTTTYDEAAAAHPSAFKNMS